MSDAGARALHHLDLWVADPVVAAAEWGWLLGELGWEAGEETGDSASWRTRTAPTSSSNGRPTRWTRPTIGSAPG